MPPTSAEYAPDGLRSATRTTVPPRTRANDSRAAISPGPRSSGAPTSTRSKRSSAAPVIEAGGSPVLTSSPFDARTRVTTSKSGLSSSTRRTNPDAHDGLGSNDSTRNRRLSASTRVVADASARSAPPLASVARTRSGTRPGAGGVNARVVRNVSLGAVHWCATRSSWIPSLSSSTSLVDPVVMPEPWISTATVAAQPGRTGCGSRTLATRTRGPPGAAGVMNETWPVDGTAPGERPSPRHHQRGRRFPTVDFSVTPEGARQRGTQPRRLACRGAVLRRHEASVWRPDLDRDRRVTHRPHRRIDRGRDRDGDGDRA